MTYVGVLNIIHIYIANIIFFVIIRKPLKENAELTS
jgi:hypothetical protein